MKGPPSVFFFLGAAMGLTGADSPPPMPRWGVDAALTAYATAKERTAYLPRLREAGIGWLRERTPNPAMAGLHDGGFQVVSFPGLGSLPTEQRGDALPEDLLAVYLAAKAMQHRHGRYVDAWEMVGEADVGYCRDLPDRVAAFQKAVYLGIKAAAAEDATGRAPIVLMGALALPPGPWLERAARNGLLDYTDAYNLHFYGFASDLAGVICAHRAFAGPLLPLWITECGIDAMETGDFLNADRRRMQADFTVATAARARATAGVAVFMPFILQHEGDPHALTLGPDRPLPAWAAYAGYAGRHPFPARRLARPPPDPNPMVLQWMPDNRTAIPNKVSGTYRFWERDPMRGALRIYNFSAIPVRGVLEVDPLRHVLLKSRVLFPATLTIPAFGRREVPVELMPAASGYFREFCDASFRDEQGRRSPLYFGLEELPWEDDFFPVPLGWGPSGAGVDHPDLDGAAVSSRSDVWTGINGLQVRARGPEVVASVAEVETDPLRPTVAIARIAGLPADGFLRLQLDRPMDADFQVRVDLVDRLGQRFAIWENFGASYFGPRDDIWLNLADFNVYFWGRCAERPVLHPADIGEIRLRCYFRRANDPRRIHLSFLRPAASADPNESAGFRSRASAGLSATGSTR